MWYELYRYLLTLVCSLTSLNWAAVEKLKAVLPEDQDGVTGYSIIGTGNFLHKLLVKNAFDSL
jgi:hypothetical protein